MKAIKELIRFVKTKKQPSPGTKAKLSKEGIFFVKNTLVTPNKTIEIKG